MNKHDTSLVLGTRLGIAYLVDHITFETTPPPPPSVQRLAYMVRLTRAYLGVPLLIWVGIGYGTIGSLLTGS